jgi:ABC-2 type transport system ATP-binding protein
VPAIDVRQLTVHYGKRVAVDGLTLAVDSGEIVALLGPNGAGKSSALSALAGATLPTDGHIAVGGVELRSRPLDARRQIGFCDQPPSLYEYFTVAEHLAFVAETRGQRDAQHDDLLARLGLSGIADRLCRELSFGMRQRVGLAAALVGEVSVILLDETLNGLDPRAAKQARHVVQDAAANGAAVLMSTHLLGVAERFCTRIVIMDHGTVRADVSGAELEAVLAKGPGAVEDLYLAHVREASP